MIETESLLIVDDSPDGRLENARQHGSSNALVFLNKFEGAQMEHVQRIWTTEAAKNQIRMVSSATLPLNQSFNLKAME